MINFEDLGNDVATLLIKAEEAYSAANYVLVSSYVSKILEQDHNIPRAWQLAAILMYRQNNWEKAAEFIKRALLEEPNNSDYLMLLADALKAQGFFDAAKSQLLTALEVAPNNLQIIAALGQFELEQNNLSDSYGYYKYYIEQDQTNAAVFNNLGCITANSNLTDEAIEYFTQAIILNPNQSDAHNNLGNMFRRKGKLLEAKREYKKSIKINPNYAAPYNNLANIYKNKNQFKTAIKFYNQAIRINPEYAEAINNLGLTMLSSGELEQAENYLRQALKMVPSNFETPHNLGLCLFKMEKYEEAKYYLQYAATLNKNWETLLYLGKISGVLENIKEAIYYTTEAAILNPNNVDILYHLGKYYQQSSNYVEARSYYNKVQELDPKHIPSLASLMYMDLLLHDWKNTEINKEKFAGKLKNYKFDTHLISLLEILALPVSMIDYKKIAAKQNHYLLQESSKHPKYSYKNNEKIKIGYLSPDFNYHPIGMMLNDIFKHHDRSKFHITCYNLLNASTNPYSERIKSGSDNFIDLYNLTTKQAADVINNDGIEILVDLAGYTTHAKPEILALRPAPIQCHWLGYSESMHAPFIQYFISNNNVITPDNRNDFSENIAYMPNTSVIMTSKFEIKHCSREQYNLPNDKFIYCNFSQPYRITPQLFELWMNILAKTPNSILWMHGFTGQQKENLLAVANNHAIDNDRLFFNNEIVLTDNWYLQLADVWLDPIHMSSGTGICLSLLADLPTIALAGNTAQSRTSSSILASCDLPELICQTTEEYIARAIELYENKEKLNNIKNKIKLKKSNFPIFAEKPFIENMEKIFLQMVDAYKTNKFSDIFV